MRPTEADKNIMQVVHGHNFVGRISQDWENIPLNMRRGTFEDYFLRRKAEIFSRFSLSLKLDLETFCLLRTLLAGETRTELLDLLSGQADVPLALLKALIVQRVYLFDVLANERINNSTLRGLKLRRKVFAVQGQISPLLPLPKLPPISTVTLLNTGTVIPREKRERREHNVRFTHVVDHFDVPFLELLFNALQGHHRDLFFVDGTRHIDPDHLVTVVERHIRQVLKNCEGWTLASIHHDSDMNLVYGKLVNTFS